MANAVNDLELVLLQEYENGSIDEEELLLLMDDQGRKNPAFPYWEYNKFTLENWSNEECWVDFRFHKEELLHLNEHLGFPGEFTTYNRIKFDPMEGFVFSLDV